MRSPLSGREKSRSGSDSSPEYLLRQADRCRRLAGGIGDETAREALLVVAQDYERRAQQVLSEGTPPVPDPSNDRDPPLG